MGKMDDLITKLQNLHKSTQKLESALQEFWGLVDELEEDKEFSGLTKQKNANMQKQNLSLLELTEKIAEFKSCLDEIPEDGTVAIDLEDALSELTDLIKQNR